MSKLVFSTAANHEAPFASLSSIAQSVGIPSSKLALNNTLWLEAETNPSYLSAIQPCTRPDC